MNSSEECAKPMSGAADTKSTSATRAVAIGAAVSADMQGASTASGLAVLIDLVAQAIQFSVSLGLVLLLAGAVCFGLMMTAGHFSRSARTSRQATRSISLRSLAERLKAASHNPDSGQLPSQLVRDINAAARQVNLQSLGELTNQARELLDIDHECYEVHVVDRTEELRGFTREEPDETGVPVRGCYVIVEARDSTGQTVSRPVRISAATGGMTAVRWAERVPEDVYERLVCSRDEGGDGPTLFAIKERDQPTLQVRMIGADGQPLIRKQQLTEW